MSQSPLEAGKNALQVNGMKAYAAYNIAKDFGGDALGIAKGIGKNVLARHNTNNFLFPRANQPPPPPRKFRHHGVYSWPR